MATRKLSLILELRDHRAIIASMKGLADTASSIAAQTAKQRQEVDALEVSYRRLQNTINTTAVSAAKLSGGPANGANGMYPAMNGGGGGRTGAPKPYTLATPGGPSYTYTPGPVSGGGQSKGSGPRMPMGPYQRMAQLQAQIQQYMANPGSQEQGQDLRLAWEKNQKDIFKLENPPTPPPPPPPKTRLQLLGQAITTSRFGAGGLQPLVGRSIAALAGEGAAAGPIGGIAIAAMAAAAALHKMVSEAAAATHEFTLLRAMSGGNSYETARLAGLGIGGGESRSLMERISRGGVEQGVAAKFGVTAMPGPYGTMDSAATTLKLIEGLRTESEAQQRRDMRILGLEGFAGLMKLTDGTFNLLKRDASLRALIQSPLAQRRAEEYNTSGKRLSDSTENLTQSLSGPLMNDLTFVQNNMATKINNMAKYFAKHPKVVDFAWDSVKGAMGFSNNHGFHAWMNRKMGIKGGNSENASTTHDEHTDALKENSNNLRRLTKTFQQSQHANEASPQALKGMGFHKALAAGALPRGRI